MTKIKGMQNIQTLCGRAHRDKAVTGSRVQTANELAYLEHSKDQLERELEVWSSNLNRAQGRLQSVRERIDLLQRTLEEMEPSPRRRASVPDQQAEDNSQEARPRWREVSLGY